MRALLARQVLASMGPRHCCRGIRSASDHMATSVAMLQWGHGIAAVESLYSSATRPFAMLLQWGHGIAAVES